MPVHASRAGFGTDACEMQYRTPGSQIDFAGVQVSAAIAAVAVEIKCDVHRCAVNACPCARTGTHAIAIDPQAQVDFRQLQVPSPAKAQPPPACRR